jgi:cbb3-type cytochrome oxidase maturation protein
VNLATYMMTATIAVFALGALFALAWSVAAGQWKDLAAASRIVLDEDEE